MAQKKPVIDQKAAEQMNLNVLKRIDPDIEDLLATAGHVALYDFDIPTKRWSRKDVEGSLFLVKRRGQARFQFIILNKKSAVGTDTFVEEVHGGFQCEVSKPYVLYRNRANEVVGIWFYEEVDCDRISALFQKIASTFAAPSEAGAGPGGTAAPSAPAEDAAATAASAATAAEQEASSGDEGFWDRRVTVLDDVAAQGSGAKQQQAPAAATAEAAPPNGHHAVPQGVAGMAAVRPALPVPSQLGVSQPVAAAGEAAPAAGTPASTASGSNNDLARLFAGIKVCGASASAAAATPTAVPAAGTPAAAAAPVMLLTPQLLQQEAAVLPASALTPAAMTAAATAPAPPEAEAAGAPGNLLLQNLLRGAQQQQVAVAALAAPPQPRPQFPAGLLPLPLPVDISEAADRALCSKVTSLLHSLAGNKTFCNIIAAELKRAGLV